MRTSPFISACAALAVCLSLPIAAQAEEIIKNFDVTANVSADRMLKIEEAITYDFGDVEKHGIFRDIPIDYERNGGSYSLRLSVLDVTRDDVTEPYVETTQDGTLDIKIGDADKTITGSHVYRITYETTRAINFFPDHSELYWNVTGDQWAVPMEHASFTLHAPKDSKGPIAPECFTGVYGSTEHACTITETPDGYRVTADRQLEAYEGMTVVVSFKPGAILAPTPSEIFWQFVSDNGIVAMPIVAFFIMFALWWKRGKDPAKRTVIPEYEPPNGLTPAVLRTCMEEGDVPKQVITATIIDLARRGYLHIRFGEEKGLFGMKQTFTFVRQKESDGSLASFEQRILIGLFAGGTEQTIDDLKKSKFYSPVASATKEIEQAVDLLHVFVKNPGKVRGIYITTGFVFAFLFAFISWSMLALGSGIVTGIIIAIFGWFMPRRTAEGVALFARAQGFKWFLSVTEKDRLAFTDAPKRTPEQFQAFLPYAIALGVEEAWAAQFASLSLAPPDWAEGNIGTFHAVAFANSLSSLSRSASSSAYSAPSQAGSGSSGFSSGGSGGGFGGGGGGSW